MKNFGKYAGLVLALGTFAVAEQPRMTPETGQSQQQNRNEAVQITQQPRVESAGDNNASIAWSTNVQAGSRVRYGTDPNNLSQTATAPWGALTHRVELKNLQPNTTYYFQAISEHASGSGTSATSSVSQFRTSGNGQQAQYGDRNGNDRDRDHDRDNAAYQDRDRNNGYNDRDRDHDRDRNNQGYRSDERGYQNGGDNVAIVAGPIVQNLSPNFATLWWQTNNTAANDVRYGTDPNRMDQRAYERGGSKDHTADLDNLQPGRTYYYQILRRDGSVRSTGQFSTPMQNAYGYNQGNGYPQNGQNYPQGNYPQNYPGNRRGNGMITQGPVIETLGPNMATIVWSTPMQASSIVRYGTDPHALNMTAQGGWSSAAHRVTLNNLQPNTHYYFDVISAPQAQRGNMPAMSMGQFQTLSPGQAAMNVSQWRY